MRLKGKDYLVDFLKYISTKGGNNSVSLEGGAALVLVYKLKRVLSNDLDFTCSSSLALRHFINLCVEYAGSKGYRIGSNILDKYGGRLTFLKVDRGIFHTDVYCVNRNDCEYSQRKVVFRGSFFHVQVHSINDIIAEKLCGLIDPTRIKYRDIDDLLLLQKLRYSRNKVDKLFRQKATAKKFCPTKLTDLQKEFPKILKKFEVKFPRRSFDSNLIANF